MTKKNGRPVIFGEVLFDRFPEDNAVLGGAPFNVAWHLQGFGSSPLFLSRVGDDDPGESVRQAMTDWGLDVSGLQTDAEHPTGSVEIKMTGNKHSFNILPDQAYDHIDIHQSREAIPEEPSLFYHGTLIMRTDKVRRALGGLLSVTSLPVFVDVNLRDPWWRAEDLPSVLKRARWAKVNDEELETISDHHGLGAGSLENTARQLQAEYELEFLIVTLGEQGALCFDGSQDVVEVTPQPQEEVVDTVGAGDAFSSVVLQGLLQGWSMRLTMERAQAFAARICGQRGATRADRGLYSEMLQEWARHPA
jgi:fructokinase